MNKSAFLLSLILIAGCNSDDDSTFLPDPVPPVVPGPGELPIDVVVVQFNLKDEVCEGESALDRNGVLTHTWTAITAYMVSEDEVMVVGDLTTTWQNKCFSETVFPNATETYDLTPVASTMVITTTPEYFQPGYDETP